MGLARQIIYMAKQPADADVFACVSRRSAVNKQPSDKNGDRCRGAGEMCRRDGVVVVVVVRRRRGRGPALISASDNRTVDVPPTDREKARRHSSQTYDRQSSHRGSSSIAHMQ